MLAKRGRKKNWGKWKFDPVLLTLTYQPHFYQMDLEHMRSSAQILDFIFQARTLGYLSNDDRADLLEAIDDLLYPQNNYCSFGAEKMTRETLIKLMKELQINGELVNLKE